MWLVDVTHGFRNKSDCQKPQSVHQQRMVSKQLLQESMSRLAEVNTYHCDRQNVLHHAFISESFFLQIRSLVISWSHYSQSRAIDLPTLCPKLQALTIRIDSDHIPELCSDSSATSEMRDTALAQSLLLVRSIKSFRLVDRPSFLAEERMGSDFEAHRLRRAANVRQLGKVLRRMVQRTQEENETSSSQTRTGRPGGEASSMARSKKVRVQPCRHNKTVKR
jgi:hypothetical protein